MFLFLSQALAADPPTVKVGGTVFAHYAYTLTPGAEGSNEFALDRASLTARATLDGHLAARLTLDANRMSPVPLADGTFLTVDTRYRAFVKHAYVEGRWESVGIKVRGGVVDTPYTSFYDSFVDARYITESFPRAAGVLDTGDLGVAAMGTQGRFDWNVSLLNGEGYSKPEVDAGKSVQARLTVDPLAKGGVRLPITGFVSYSGHPAAGGPTLTYIGAVGLEQAYVVAWAEYLGVSGGGSGYSGTLSPRLPEVGALFLRYDHLDPDVRASGDATTTIIAGVTHDFFDHVSLAATYERTTSEAAPGVPEHAVVARLQAGF